MSNLATAAVYPTAISATVYPVVNYDCEVIDISPLNADTFQIELQSPVGTVLEYHAGQYLQLKLDVNGDGKQQSLSYSIANRANPNHPRRLRLFIQNSSEFVATLLKRLKQHRNRHTAVSVVLPMGKAFLQTNLSLPHVLIAAGSGITKIRCITEEILKRQPEATVNIYWSNKHIDEFYRLDEFQGWAEQYPHLSFTPILESPSSDWSGRCGYIYQVVQADFTDLNNAQTYLCGSPQMVYGTIDQLKALGLDEENCYSDVFEYAPRD